jgi:hypothetical protein
MIRVSFLALRHFGVVLSESAMLLAGSRRHPIHTYVRLGSTLSDNHRDLVLTAQYNQLTT